MGEEQAAAASAVAAATFTYYDPDFLAVRRLTPAGGPTSGGSEVVVAMLDDRLLLDLGGLRCRFARPDSAGPVLPSSVTELTVPATIGSGAYGPTRNLRCTAPKPPDEWIAMGSWYADALVEVTLNGVDYSTSAQPARFRYYNADVVGVGAITPWRGPVAGGTTVTVSGTGLLDLGASFCRFGSNDTGYNVVPATSIGLSRATCVAPPVRRLACEQTCEAHGDVPMDSTRRASDPSVHALPVRFCLMLDGRACVRGESRVFSYSVD